MKRYLLYILLTFAVCLNVAAQNSSKQGFRPTRQLYNLGDVEWKQPRTVDVQFENKGKRAVVLDDVRTDCACATTQWMKGHLLEAGHATTLRVTFDAQTLGRFSRKLHVRVIADNNQTQECDVTIIGRVVPHVVDYVRDYPYSIGNNISLSNGVVEFDDVLPGTYVQQTLYVANTSDKEYAPQLMHLPSWLTVCATPERLRPGTTGKLVFSADVSKVQRYGITQTTIYMSRFPGDRVGQDNSLQVNLVVVPRPAGQSSGLMPQISVADSVQMQPRIRKNVAPLQGEVKIYNTGTAPLEISRLQVYNTGIRVSINKTKIPPQSSARLRVSLDDLDKRLLYKGSRRVLLITNDPQRPKVTIRVTVPQELMDTHKSVR